MSITRKRLRELTMKIVYEYDFYPPEELKDQAAVFLQQQELQEEDAAAILERAAKVFECIPSIDARLNKAAKGWTTARMNRIDLALLRLAVYEIDNDAETPVKVAINEAVELAKVYGGEESPKFVNGVLSKFAKEDA